jgi:hypothetical protein
LLTYLVPPGDPALNAAPLLRAAADNWMAALATRVRHCIVCSAWIVDRTHVGALLMSTAATSNPTSAATAAVCRECWEADLPIDALEKACATVLHEVIPDGRFAPLDAPR